MIYHVRAKLRKERAAEFLRRLTDGSIARQRPDGAEIVASMERATVGEDGQVEWSETCFCSPPLQHERETVLDAHFTDLTVEPIEGHRRYDGAPLMEYLRGIAGQSSKGRT